MSDIQSISRENALLAIKASGISHRVDGNDVTFYLDQTVEVVTLPDAVGRRLLGRMTAKFGVRPEFFYRPEMALAELARRESQDHQKH